MSRDIIKVVPYTSSTEQMFYDIVDYRSGDPVLVARFNDNELASQVRIFLTALLVDSDQIPDKMTTLEFHSWLVRFGIFHESDVRGTAYAHMRSLRLTPIAKKGRTLYYSKRQLRSVVQDRFPLFFNSMVDSVSSFGKAYSLIRKGSL